MSKLRHKLSLVLLSLANKVYGDNPNAPIYRPVDNINNFSRTFLEAVWPEKKPYFETQDKVDAITSRGGHAVVKNGIVYEVEAEELLREIENP